MKSSNRIRHAALIVLAAIASPVIAQVTIDPGMSASFANADNCATAEDRAGLLGFRTETRCDPANSSMGAEIDVGPYFDFGRISARSAVWVEFDVGSTPDTVGNAVPAWFNYGIAWKGLLQQFDILSSSSVEVSYEIINRTTGTLIKTDLVWARDADGFKVKVGGKIPVQITRNVDEGSVSDFASVLLTRGHRYRFLVRLTCNATLLGETGGTHCDYYDDSKGRGASLRRLIVRLGQDDLETLERLDRIEEDIQEIREDVDALKHHTHDYLTGRGVGHNNTDAQTSPPVFDGDGAVSDATGDAISPAQSEPAGATGSPPAAGTSEAPGSAGPGGGGSAFGLMLLLLAGLVARKVDGRSG